MVVGRTHHTPFPFPLTFPHVRPRHSHLTPPSPRPTSLSLTLLPTFLPPLFFHLHFYITLPFPPFLHSRASDTYSPFTKHYLLFYSLLIFHTLYILFYLFTCNLMPRAQNSFDDMEICLRLWSISTWHPIISLHVATN